MGSCRGHIEQAHSNGIVPALSIAQAPAAKNKKAGNRNIEKTNGEKLSQCAAVV
jgi:hypothetical protein